MLVIRSAPCSRPSLICLTILFSGGRGLIDFCNSPFVTYLERTTKYSMVDEQITYSSLMLGELDEIRKYHCLSHCLFFPIRDPARLGNKFHSKMMIRFLKILGRVKEVVTRNVSLFIFYIDSLCVNWTNNNSWRLQFYFKNCNFVV